MADDIELLNKLRHKFDEQHWEEFCLWFQQLNDKMIVTEADVDGETVGNPKDGVIIDIPEFEPRMDLVISLKETEEAVDLFDYVLRACKEGDGTAQDGIDIVRFNTNGNVPLTLTSSDGSVLSGSPEVVWPVLTTLYAIPTGIGFMIGDYPFRFGFPSESDKSLWTDILEDNKKRGLTVPAELCEAPVPPEAVKPLTVAKFPIHTSQEWRVLIGTTSWGRGGRYLTENEQAGALRFQPPNSSFYTEGKLLDVERNAGCGVEILRDLLHELDIDSGFMLLYISECLAPVREVGLDRAVTGWIDLDDVANKTLGGYAATPEEKKQRRAKVWSTIEFGARWCIAGRRSVPYYDRQNGQSIDTEIYTCLWQIVSRQETLPTLHIAAETTPPVRVELVASRQWTALTTGRDTAQYLPFGEVLGSIPAGKAQGAWARALGLTYITWARTNTVKALDHRAPPKRRQLLEMFPPSRANYQELLGTTHADRIHKYWIGAEAILSEEKVIWVPSGREPKPKGAKQWDAWLNSPPNWQPGESLSKALTEQRRNLYEPKPKQLNPAKRRGRPRKH
jgi:hypothetical protein